MWQLHVLPEISWFLNIIYRQEVRDRPHTKNTRLKKYFKRWKLQFENTSQRKYISTWKSVIPNCPWYVTKSNNAFDCFFQIFPCRIEIHTLWFQRHFESNSLLRVFLWEDNLDQGQIFPEDFKTRREFFVCERWLWNNLNLGHNQQKSFVRSDFRQNICLEWLQNLRTNKMSIRCNSASWFFNFFHKWYFSPNTK